MATPRRVRKPLPAKGLVTALPADSIGPDFTPNCYNVRFKFGQVRHGPGRGVLTGSPVNEIVRNMGFATNPLGEQIPYMFTDSKLWTQPGDKLAVPAGPWTNVPSTGSGLGTVNISATNPSRFGLAIGEGYMFFTRNQKLGGVAYSSDAIFRWDISMGAAGYQCLYKSSSYQPPAGLSSVAGAGAVSGKFLEYMNGHLVAFNVVEQVNDAGFPVTGKSSVLPQRIRWSESGQHLHWNDTLGLGAGFIDLWEGDSTPVVGVARLRDDAVIVRGESIGHFRPTFQLQPEFSYETRLRGFGTRAPYSVASSGSAVFFLGTDGIVYSWDGSNLAPIGGAIQDQITAWANIFTSNTYSQWEEQTGIVGVCSPERGEYWLLIRDNAQGNDTQVFVWDWVRQCWTRDTFPDITCLGSLNIGTSVLSHIPAWFGGGSDGRTFAIDENISGDYYAIGSIIDRYIETEDMYFDPGTGADPWNLGTVIRMLLVYDYMSAVPFEVGISTDRGHTYLTKMVTPSPSGYSIIDLGPKTGNVVRFRFREKDLNAQFRWTSYSFQLIDAGEFIGTTT